MESESDELRVVDCADNEVDLESQRRVGYPTPHPTITLTLSEHRPSPSPLATLLASNNLSSNSPLSLTL